ncbi:MAG TPA: hypothetical protein PKE56_14925, partial [Acidimicrobiales bacterium]|nr:hypothetical protein [Acidimicrobiales bacterium]
DRWGLNWAESAAGTHGVCFGPVAGYVAPPCEPVDLAEGEVAEVQGAYSQQGYLRVMTSPPLPSTVFVDGIERNDWGLWAEVDPGPHEVCFGAVAGFEPPACRIVEVDAGTTATTTGTFVADAGAQGPTDPFGYLRATTDPAVAVTDDRVRLPAHSAAVLSVSG